MKTTVLSTLKFQAKLRAYENPKLMVNAFTMEKIGLGEKSEPFEIYSAGMEETDGYWSDRMFEQNPDLYNDSCRQVWGNEGQSFSERTPEEIELFLRAYIKDRALRLSRVVICTNLLNGHDRWYFGVQR
ncbi:hypothetical protein [Vibrio sp. D431a]|uniref:hypothetical protein n=1 Tax=Vibrio sp. D431a TaxID=2837388 RepID=UPI002554F024|nr:hypothetical protein [Vibrio sp. D431a]MDK9793696.1 hypothetical protein [Vibrio sp. D431a]